MGKPDRGSHTRGQSVLDLCPEGGGLSPREALCLQQGGGWAALRWVGGVAGCRPLARVRRRVGVCERTQGGWARRDRRWEPGGCTAEAGSGAAGNGEGQVGNPGALVPGQRTQACGQR